MTFENDLLHYGVKGMKWGHHKERYNSVLNMPLAPRQEFKTEKGVSVALTETPNNKLTALLAGASKKLHKIITESRAFDIEVNGVQVGDAAFRRKSADELNLTWLGVNQDQRGKGYASTVFDAGIAYAKSQGYTKLSLEVPGNAPDARHIYEKRGFTTTGKTMGDRTDVWGGLTEMTLDLTPTKVRHSADDVTEEEMELAQYQFALAWGFNPDMLTDPRLRHYGVKGMHWGRRKNPETARAERDYARQVNYQKAYSKAESKAKTRQKLKKGAVITGGVLAVAGGVALAVVAKKSGNGRAAEKAIQESLKIPFQWKDQAGNWHTVVDHSPGVPIGRLMGHDGLSENDVTFENDLLHYGVKGMHWGVRKSGEVSKRAARKEARATIPDSADAVKARTHRNTAKLAGTSKLSNEELQAVVTRMNLEQQYARLNPTTTKKVQNNIQSVLKSGRTLNDAISFANSPGGKILKERLNK